MDIYTRNGRRGLGWVSFADVPSTDFKTVTIDHSDTPPQYKFYSKKMSQGNFADIFLGLISVNQQLQLHCE